MFFLRAAISDAASLPYLQCFHSFRIPGAKASMLNPSISVSQASTLPPGCRGVTQSTGSATSRAQNRRRPKNPGQRLSPFPSLPPPLPQARGSPGWVPPLLGPPLWVPQFGSPFLGPPFGSPSWVPCCGVLEVDGPVELLGVEDIEGRSFRQSSGHSAAAQPVACSSPQWGL